MKSVKLFLLVGCVLLLTSAAATAYVWNMVQETLSVSSEAPVVEEEAADSSAETQHGSVREDTSEMPVAESVPDAGVALPAESLSASQKAVLDTMGIEIDSFVITPAMVRCAEEKLGSSRVRELMDGVAPTLLEVASLTPCL